MLVRNIMLKDVAVVDPAISFRTAAQKMYQAGMRLLIVADRDSILGFVTTRELVLGAEAQSQLQNITCVGDVANSRFLLTHEAEPVQSLVRRMVDEGVRRAIVVDAEGRAAGLVTPLELARVPQPHGRQPSTVSDHPAA